MKIRFYTTSGCHLCEEAQKLLVTLQNEGMGLDIDSVDIADSELLLERYGIRIPVVAVIDTAAGREIGWPFSLEELRAFLTGGS